MLERTDLEFPAQVAHPAGFQLEHASVSARFEQIVGLLVVKRQMVNVNFDSFRALDHFTGVTDDGQRLQPKKIHFQQAKVADGIHSVLRDERAAVVLLERKQEIHQRLVADDDAGGVDARIAREVFENQRGINQLRA